MDHVIHTRTRRPRHPAAIVLAAFTASLTAACGGSDKQQPPPEYAQADLTGTWDFVAFQTAAQPGWQRLSATVDATGATSVTTFEDQMGSTSAPTGLALKVDAAGAVQETALGVPTAFHGFLAKDKKLLAGVSTPVAATYALNVGRKRDATVTWSNADVRNRTFALHSLREGADGWRFGTGSIDADGLVSIASAIGPSLTSVTVPPPDGLTLSVDAQGFVSDGGAFRGFLSTDKSTIFAVHTDPNGGTYAVTILQFTGGSFTQADLAGTWAFSSLAGNNTPIWLTGELDIDPAGVGSYTSQLDSTGSTALSASATLHLAANGSMTNTTNASYRGTIALGGDMYVRTQTHGGAAGRYGIGVVLRR